MNSRRAWKRSVSERGSVMLIVLVAMAFAVFVAALALPRRPAETLRDVESAVISKIIMDVRNLGQTLQKAGMQDLSAGGVMVPSWQLASLRQGGIDVQNGVVLLRPTAAGIFSIGGLQVLRGRLAAEILRSPAPPSLQEGVIRFSLQDIRTDILSLSTSSVPIWSPEMSVPMDPAYGFVVQTRRLSTQTENTTRFSPGTEILQIQLPDLQADQGKWFGTALLNIEGLLVTGRLTMNVRFETRNCGPQRVTEAEALEGIPVWFRPSTVGCGGGSTVLRVVAGGTEDCIVRKNGWTDYVLYSKDQSALGQRFMQVTEF